MLAKPEDSPVAAAPHLTARETMIISLMSSGHTTPEIARMLDLRPRTVENHKRHIYEKLGVGGQGRAIAKAISLGLLKLERPGSEREQGRATLVLLPGPAGEGRDTVARVLISEGLPFAIGWKPGRLTREHWARWHRGPMVVVLIDPAPEDWSPSISLGLPTVVVCSRAVSDRVAIADALALRASGLVALDDIATGLGLALDAVAHGMFVMSRMYTQALVTWAPGPAPTAPKLTARERDILDLIAVGHTIRQTARALGIAAKTVENTQARLFRKLGARNRAETLTIAERWGLIDRTMFLADNAN